MQFLFTRILKNNMFKKIKMPKIKMPNVVANVKDLGKKIGKEVKGSTQSAVKSVKGLNPFKK